MLWLIVFDERQAEEFSPSEQVLSERVACVFVNLLLFTAATPNSSTCAFVFFCRRKRMCKRERPLAEHHPDHAPSPHLLRWSAGQTRLFISFVECIIKALGGGGCCHKAGTWFKQISGQFWAENVDQDQTTCSAVCCFHLVVNSNTLSSSYLAHNAACSCQCVKCDRKVAVRVCSSCQTF